MQNMLSSLLLLALLILPSALQQQGTVEQKIDLLVEGVGQILGGQADILEGFVLQSTEIREATQNATNQLLTELDTLRGRQAVSAAVQVSQVLMFVVYLLTTISVYVVKRCRKVREKSQRKEFELLEKKLLSNKAKRRAAAAKEKSAPAPSKE